jgi:integrase
MVVLSLNTGLRRGEVFSLTWNSVNFQTKTLTEGATAKSGQTQPMPLNDEALNALTQRAIKPKGKDWCSLVRMGIAYTACERPRQVS